MTATAKGEHEVGQRGLFDRPPQSGQTDPPIDQRAADSEPTARDDWQRAIEPPAPRRREDGPCPWCHRFQWWRSASGVVVCGNCHPPMDPEAVQWIEPPPAPAGQSNGGNGQVSYQQKAMFDVQPPAATPTAPYAGGSETSKAAAEAIRPRAGRLRKRVYRFVADRGQLGATDEELCEALSLRPDTGRARRCELRDSGHVANSGRRRPTRSGRMATVWVATGEPLSIDGEGR